MDVTLAVEGRFLRAHKMVLSACSPYFQALFVGHPDKHPIVILKDVPYCDMRSLLDFMYRGEVSVDQDRLTAFLKVAESLRIKGLTEVNEEKCDLPSITSSLLSSVPPPVVTTHTPPPPPHLHRIHPTSSPHKRTIPMPSASSATSSNPLLGSALTAPKRKRGRPRKLSGSSGGASSAPGLAEGATSSSGSSSRHQSAMDGNGEVENSPRLSSADSLVAQESPELLELKMGMEFQHSPAANSGSSKRPSNGENGSGPGPNTSSAEEGKTPNKESAPVSHSKQVKEEPEPTPGPSSQDPGQAFIRPSNTNDPEQYALDPIILPKSEVREDGQGESEGGGGGNGGGERLNSPGGEQQQSAVPPASASAPPPSRPPIKRRARRRATSASQDPAEQLTEMSVRGLNLFRYASISEGVYKCTECAKSDVQKTFKNKYSFQRHAFLYHEGHQRKVFPCPVCAKEFSRPDKMKNHMKTVHDCFMPKDCVFPLGFFLPH